MVDFRSVVKPDLLGLGRVCSVIVCVCLSIILYSSSLLPHPHLPTLPPKNPLCNQTPPFVCKTVPFSHSLALSLILHPAVVLISLPVHPIVRNASPWLPARRGDALHLHPVPLQSHVKRARKGKDHAGVR